MSDYYKLFNINDGKVFCSLLNLPRDDIKFDMAGRTWILHKNIKQEKDDKVDINGDVWRIYE